MKKIIQVLLLVLTFTGTVHADQEALERERARMYFKKTGEVIVDDGTSVGSKSHREIANDRQQSKQLRMVDRISDELQTKLILEDGKITEPLLTPQEEAHLTNRGWRNRRDGEFDPPVSKFARPADYESEVKRGTVEFDPGPARWRNYSYHTVKVPDGTVFDGDVDGGCNFTQIAPDTDAFVRTENFGHNLTFRNCNLVNVRVYDDWTIENSNTSQIDRIGTVDEEGNIDIVDSIVLGNSSKQVNKNRNKPVGVLE